MAVTVWNVENDGLIEVSEAEAAAGMMRFARSLGPGTPACGVWEMRAIEMLSEGR